MKKILLSFAAALLLVTSVFAGETGKKKDVGIFYFVWLGQHPGQQKGIYDISKLLKEAPEDLSLRLQFCKLLCNRLDYSRAKKHFDQAKAILAKEGLLFETSSYTLLRALEKNIALAAPN